MPLARMRLQNFKCFADSGDIPLAPLTVLFGRNNSGKSSILQSLLLLRQSLDSTEHGSRLNMQGPLYPVGSFADIVHQHQSRQHISMQFDMDIEGSSSGTGTYQDRPKARIEIEFCSDEPQAPRLARLYVAHPGAESLEIRRGRGSGGPYELVIGGKVRGGAKTALFVFPAGQLLPIIGPEPLRRGRPSPSRETSRKAAQQILGLFRSILVNMRAVGAFRRQPERRYEYKGRVSEVIDAVGENVVNALIEDFTRRRRRGELIRSVNRWLKAVGRVRLMPLRRISRTARIFEIRLKDTDSGRWANFADVGFGIGQAFPVFVEGLRTPPGGLFLVQEPEIHLHPDAQLAMADFLVSLARTGRRVIAETHSEHLLLRIRHAVVASRGRRGGKSRFNPEDVSVIHVDKHTDGTSHVRRLDMDELGQIKKWPADFMEEATQERMALMQDMASRAESME